MSRVQESFRILEIPSICTINGFLVCPDLPNFVYFKVFWLSIVTCFVPSCNMEEFLDMWCITILLYYLNFVWFWEWSMISDSLCVFNLAYQVWECRQYKNTECLGNFENNLINDW